MFFYIIGTIILSYLIAKTLVIKLENENERLKQELVFVKTKRQEDKDKYQERIGMMNDAFEQFKKGSR